MVNNVIRVVNYVIAARPSLLNFMIADTQKRRIAHSGQRLSRDPGSFCRITETTETIFPNMR